MSNGREQELRLRVKKHLQEGAQLLAINDNYDGRYRNLELAAWKMLRAGFPPELITTSLRLSNTDLVKLGQTGAVLAAGTPKPSSPTA